MIPNVRYSVIDIGATTCNSSSNDSGTASTVCYSTNTRDPKEEERQKQLSEREALRAEKREMLPLNLLRVNNMRAKQLPKQPIRIKPQLVTRTQLPRMQRG